ncbi:hypothetical protein HPP92_000581 [Vanilla planifolia]|uniref:Uncharacterized protein n=1 Tax=Vanilla planifolia TaxID=51239 RepID=A0A835RYC8_VANPL|nr:hypothetical protein HPP92_000581 [Vanilla planifolia]
MHQASNLEQQIKSMEEILTEEERDRLTPGQKAGFLGSRPRRNASSFAKGWMGQRRSEESLRDDDRDDHRSDK